MPKTKLKKVAKDMGIEEKTAMTPVVFSLPTDMVEEMKGSRRKYEDESKEGMESLKSHLTGLDSSFSKYRLSTHQAIMRHRALGSSETQKVRQELDGIVKELEEAFSALWPKFDEFTEGFESSKKRDGDLGSKHDAHVKKTAESILDLSSLIEKRYQSALKKLNQAKKNVEIRTDDTETKAIRLEIKRLENLIKKVGTYEYGAQLQVFLSGVMVSQTSGINLIPGTGVTITEKNNPAGFLDITISATGATGANVYNEVVSGSGTSWTLANTPTAGTLRLFANGQRLTPTVDYSISGAAITTVDSWAAGTLLADYAH